MPEPRFPLEHAQSARESAPLAHAWLYLEVPEADGSVASWNIEMGAPNALIRRGINKNTVPVGADVTVEGYRAKDGSRTVNSSAINLTDGRSLFSGSENTGAPSRPAPR